MTKKKPSIRNTKAELLETITAQHKTIQTGAEQLGRLENLLKAKVDEANEKITALAAEANEKLGAAQQAVYNAEHQRDSYARELEKEREDGFGGVEERHFRVKQVNWQIEAIKRVVKFHANGNAQDVLEAIKPLLDPPIIHVDVGLDTRYLMPEKAEEKPSATEQK